MSELLNAEASKLLGNSLDRRINKSIRHVLSTVSDALKLLLYLVSVIVPWAFFKMLGPLRGALERQTSIKNHKSIPEAWKGGMRTPRVSWWRIFVRVYLTTW